MSKRKTAILEEGVRYFLISWDNLGVEYLEDVTQYHPEEWAKQHLFNSIKQGETIPNNPLGQKVTSMTLRARYNSHRHYEIYLFTATEGMTEADVREWADMDPQGAADFVRENHCLKIWDQRCKPDNYKII